MTFKATGYTDPATGNAITIGHLPERKRPALYVTAEREGRLVATPLAYFTSEETAALAVEWLERLFVSGRMVVKGGSEK